MYKKAGMEIRNLLMETIFMRKIKLTHFFAISKFWRHIHTVVIKSSLNHLLKFVKQLNSLHSPHYDADDFVLPFCIYYIHNVSHEPDIHCNTNFGVIHLYIPSLLWCHEKLMLVLSINFKVIELIDHKSRTKIWYHFYDMFHIW